MLRDLDLAAFREHLQSGPTIQPFCYVVNFHSRPAVRQRVAATTRPSPDTWADEDLVFVLDVNEKYRPLVGEAGAALRGDEHRGSRRRQEARHAPRTLPWSRRPTIVRLPRCAASRRALLARRRHAQAPTESWSSYVVAVSAGPPPNRKRQPRYTRSPERASSAS